MRSPWTLQLTLAWGKPVLITRMVDTLCAHRAAVRSPWTLQLTLA